MLSFRQLASLVCNARPSASSFLSHSGGSKLASLVCSQVQPAASPSFLLRFSDTSAYGLGACVAFSLVGQTRFARLQCSAFGLELSTHSGGSKLASLVCTQVQPAASPS